MRTLYLVQLGVLNGAALAATFCQPSFGQTSAEINQLLQKSKLVDTGRAVNASVRSGCVVVSTYADPKARNEDCKITALLMMKELRQHFKNINKIQVLFFDPIDTSKYRDVSIRASDARLVDSGAAPAAVLAKIPVRHQRVSRPSSTSAQNVNSTGNRPGIVSTRHLSNGTQPQGSPMSKEIIMRVAKTFHFTNSAEAIWARHMNGKSANTQMTRSERTALYRDLRDQMKNSVKPDQKETALFALQQAFNLLGGADE